MEELQHTITRCLQRLESETAEVDILESVAEVMRGIYSLKFRELTPDELLRASHALQGLSAELTPIVAQARLKKKATYGARKTAEITLPQEYSGPKDAKLAQAEPKISPLRTEEAYTEALFELLHQTKRDVENTISLMQTQIGFLKTELINAKSGI